MAIDVEEEMEVEWAAGEAVVVVVAGGHKNMISSV